MAVVVIRRNLAGQGWDGMGWGGWSRVPHDSAVYMEIKSLAADCLALPCLREFQIISPL